MIARNGPHPLVTDRRILSARQLRHPSRGLEWFLDPLVLDQIVGWSKGEHHDGRPILRLTHPPLTRIKRVPAHRFLWWTWGNAVGPVVETTTTFAFGRRTNQVFRAIGAELDRRNVPEGPSFVIRPAGTRAERLREGSFGEFKRAGILVRMRVRMWRVTDVVYGGRLARPIRLASWLLVGVPAWFVSPWLVVPAILAAELAWIAFLRSSWRREQARHRIRSAVPQERPGQPAP